MYADLEAERQLQILDQAQQSGRGGVGGGVGGEWLDGSVDGGDPHSRLLDTANGDPVAYRIKRMPKDVESHRHIAHRRRCERRSGGKLRL